MSFSKRRSTPKIARRKYHPCRLSEDSSQGSALRNPAGGAISGRRFLFLPNAKPRTRVALLIGVENGPFGVPASTREFARKAYYKQTSFHVSRPNPSDTSRTFSE